MQSFKSIYFIAILVFLNACSPSSSRTDTEPEPDASISSESNTKTKGICLWKEVAIRDSPGEKSKFQTTIYLGEQFEVLADTASEITPSKKNLYRKIKLIDNTEGWIREDLIAVGGVPATFVNVATIYKRPDMMTSTGKSFQKIDFVAVKKRQDDWVEVIGKRIGDKWFTSGWVKNNNLTTAEADIAFSIFYAKAMELPTQQERESELAKILDNPDLSGSIFVPLFEVEENFQPLDSAAGV